MNIGVEIVFHEYRCSNSLQCHLLFTDGNRIKENDYTIRRDNSVKNYFASLGKLVFSKWELSILLEKTLTQEWFCVQTASYNNCLLVKRQKIFQVYPVPLIVLLYFQNLVSGSLTVSIHRT